MKPPVLCLLFAVLLASCAGTDSRLTELERQVRERDAEIADLRQRLGARLSAQATPSAQEHATVAPPAASPSAASSVARPEASDIREEDIVRALELALVREGGSILARGAIQIEPEVSYTYSEPIQGFRRDTFASAATLRVGLPWEMQAAVRVPVVIHDRQSRVGRTAGLGDLGLTLTKLLVTEREYVPELLLSGTWQAPTGRSDGALQTGSGAHAFQAGLSAVKRQDPVALFGTLSYTWNGSSGQVDYGDTLGSKLGVILAATPDTSVLMDVSLNSHSVSRVDTRRIAETDRLSGVFEIGSATVLGRDLMLNITAGVGFTAAAPDFRLTVSLPKRF
jgi:hypothetical protein